MEISKCLVDIRSYFLAGMNTTSVQFLRKALKIDVDFDAAVYPQKCGV